MLDLLRTNADIAQTKLRGVFKTVFEKDRTPPGLEIHFQSGLQAGTTVAVTKSVCTLGPDQNSDIMLLDDEALGESITLASVRSVFGNAIMITTPRSDVCASNVTLMPGVRSKPLLLPCTIDYNGILASVDAVKETESPQLKSAVFPGLLAISILAFTAQGLLGSGAVPNMNLQSGTVVQDTQTAIGGIENAETAVSDLLIQAGLEQQLTIHRSGTGMLQISGEIAPALATQWDGIRSEIDRSVGDVMVVYHVSKQEALQDLPPISAVVLGDDAHVVLADRAKLKTGDRIIKDWRIAEITWSGLSLERNGETVLVNF